MALVMIWGIILLFHDSEKLELSNSQVSSSHQKLLAKKMVNGIKLLSRLMVEDGIEISPYSDPNHTGFIGEELTSLTTTLGSLVSKRTSTNPAFAPLIYDLILKAGIKKGDMVAISASGSFPALIFASMLAVEAVGAKPFLISSIGSSTWGANRSQWSWLDMERVFYEHQLIKSRSRFISPGGPDDQGPNLFENSLDLVNQIAKRNGIPLLKSISLQEAIEIRMKLYLKEDPSLFINIGGSHVSLGGCAHGHQFPPGIIFQALSCNHTEKGLIIRFLELGTPVLNLLDIPAIALENGLPIDPVPLPVANDQI